MRDSKKCQIRPHTSVLIIAFLVLTCSCSAATSRQYPIKTQSLKLASSSTSPSQVVPPVKQVVSMPILNSLTLNGQLNLICKASSPPLLLSCQQMSLIPSLNSNPSSLLVDYQLMRAIEH